MNQGKKFEQNFAKSVPKNVYFMRIKDTVSSYSHGDGSSFTSNNPFDCFMLYNGFFLPMELKSSKEDRFSVQIEEGKTGYDIKLHQIKSLTQANNFDNVIAGFVLDFRCGNTYWISILDFNRCLADTGKKSINSKDVESHNGIIISKKIIRVNYKYDILELLGKITSKEGG